MCSKSGSNPPRTVGRVAQDTRTHARAHTHTPSICPSVHPFGPYFVQSIGAAKAVSWAIGHNPGQVTTPTQDTQMAQ